MRDALFDLAAKYPDEATWTRLRRAYDNDYLELAGGRLTANTHGPPTARKLSIIGVAVIYGSLALAAIVLGGFISDDRPVAQLIYLGELLLVILYLWICHVWWWPRQSAKTIKDILHHDAATQPKPAAYQGDLCP